MATHIPFTLDDEEPPRPSWMSATEIFPGPAHAETDATARRWSADAELERPDRLTPRRWVIREKDAAGVVVAEPSATVRPSEAWDWFAAVVSERRTEIAAGRCRLTLTAETSPRSQP